MTGDYPVLYFLGTLMNANHIRYCTSFICAELSALTKLLFLPQVTDQLFAELAPGKQIQIRINGLVACLHVFIIGVKSFQTPY